MLQQVEGSGDRSRGSLQALSSRLLGLCYGPVLHVRQCRPCSVQLADAIRPAAPYFLRLAELGIGISHPPPTGRWRRQLSTLTVQYTAKLPGGLRRRFLPFGATTGSLPQCHQRTGYNSKPVLRKSMLTKRGRRRKDGQNLPLWSNDVQIHRRRNVVALGVCGAQRGGMGVSKGSMGRSDQHSEQNPSSQ